MKNLIYIYMFILSLGVIVTSCDLDAPSKSAAEGSVVLSIEALAEGAVMEIGRASCRERV